MTLKRHQKFWLDAEKKWTEKWFKFFISQDDWDWEGVSYNPNVTIEFIERLILNILGIGNGYQQILMLLWNSLPLILNMIGIGIGFQQILI